jgi:cellulose biosynthesis protein BcsQ
LVANVSGIAARRGVRVLAIDLDPQGNLAGDFGYRKQGRRDDGRSMLRASRDLEPLDVVSKVRPGIDAIFAGFHTRELSDWLTNTRDEDATVLLSVREAIRSIESSYDLVIIDTPPAPAVLTEAGIAAADWVVSPIRADFASIDGLEHVASLLCKLQELTLTRPPVLGVILFDVATASTAVIEEVRKAVAEEAPWAGSVFDTVIRRSERCALDMRRWGLLADEYRDRAREALSSPLAQRRIDHQGLNEAVVRFSRVAEALATDYGALGAEILDRMAEAIEARTDLAVTGA